MYRNAPTMCQDKYSNWNSFVAMDAYLNMYAMMTLASTSWQSRRVFLTRDWVS